MPDSFNNLSSDQLKIMLEIMEDKIKKTEETKPKEPTAEELLDQMANLFVEFQKKSQPQTTPPQAPVEEKKQNPIQNLIDPSMQTPPAPKQPEPTPQVQNINNTTVFELIEDLLEKSGFASEINTLLLSNASEDQINSKVAQFTSIAKMMPELTNVDEVVINDYVVSVIEELDMIKNIEKEQKPAEPQEKLIQPNVQKAQQSVPIPKINLKPEDKQPKVVEIRDIFKKFKFGSPEKEVEKATVTAEVQQTIISETPKEPENTNHIQQEMIIQSTKQDTKSEEYQPKDMQKFELLTELLLTYVEGASHRELIRNSEDILQNKSFLQQLYEEAITKATIKHEIEVLELILQRINKKLGMVKAGKGTIATWVELDEDINNIQNLYLVEIRKRTL